MNKLTFRENPPFFPLIFVFSWSLVGLQSTVYNILKTLYSLIEKQTYNPIKKWGEDMSRRFPEEDMQTANKYRKTCLMSLVISDITAVTHHYNLHL